MMNCNSDIDVCVHAFYWILRDSELGYNWIKSSYFRQLFLLPSQHPLWMHSWAIPQIRTTNKSHLAFREWHLSLTLHLPHTVICPGTVHQFPPLNSTLIFICTIAHPIHHTSALTTDTSGTLKQYSFIYL